jgi:hypothetical protein
VISFSDVGLRDRAAPPRAARRFGELRDSRTGIYRLLGKAVRPIGEQAKGSSGCQSPVARMERDPAAPEPANAVAYVRFAKPGDFSEP